MKESMKAKKISLTSDMREYLNGVIRMHRNNLNTQLVKEKSNASKESIQQSIAMDTILLNKLAK